MSTFAGKLEAFLQNYDELKSVENEEAFLKEFMVSCKISSYRQSCMYCIYMYTCDTFPCENISCVQVATYSFAIARSNKPLAMALAAAIVVNIIHVHTHVHYNTCI